jgi:hypothetical protein
MNKKRTLFYLLFSFIIVIVLYNYIISPVLIQNSNNSGITMNIRMGMGMHMGMENNYNNTYSNNNNSNINNFIEGIYFIVLAILTVISSAIIYRLFLKNKGNSCNKCGYKIEDEKWRKCPACGNNLEERGNRK